MSILEDTCNDGFFISQFYCQIKLDKPFRHMVNTQKLKLNNGTCITNRKHTFYRIMYLFFSSEKTFESYSVKRGLDTSSSCTLPYTS